MAWIEDGAKCVPRRTFLAGLGCALVPAPAVAMSSAFGPGVYRGAGRVGRAQLDSFAQWLGAPPTGIVDFISYQSWKDILSSAEWIAQSWVDYGGRRTFTIPMVPRDDFTGIAVAANGGADQVFSQVAKILISKGHGEAIIRIGHEFNGDWYPWSSKNSTSGEWVSLWRRIVKIFRSTDGARFKFEWSPTCGPANGNPEEFWPGSDVVDIIGLSVYNDFVRNHQESPESRWQGHLNGPHGLKWHQAFAEAKGKQTSFPEWGTGLRPNGWGAGDDPNFIGRMAAWIRQSDLAYHNYFDYPAHDYDCQLSSGRLPRAAAEFIRQFR